MATVTQQLKQVHNRQLVVTIADLDLVRATLGELGVGAGTAQPHRSLGLALLSGLTAIGEGVQALRRDELAAPALEAAFSRSAGSATADIDLLISGMQARFAGRYPGWPVRMGRNHPVALAMDPHYGGAPTGAPIAAAMDPHYGGTPTGAPIAAAMDPHYGGAPPGGALAPVPAARKLPRLPAGSTRGRGVRVAQLDTRIFPLDWLAGRYLADPGDILEPTQFDFNLAQCHATAAASLILHQAPGAELHLHRVLDDHGITDLWAVGTAMAELADNGYHVVYLPFQWFSADGQPPVILERAISRLSSHAVLVAAAGNVGDVDGLRRWAPGLVPDHLPSDAVPYPAASPDVVAVAALDRDRSPASFSRRGSGWINLMAPGDSILTAFVRGTVNLDGPADLPSSYEEKFDGWATCCGTSYAAAIAAGEIAARTIPGSVPAHHALEQLLGSGANGTPPHNRDG